MEQLSPPISGGKRFVLDWLGPVILLFMTLNVLAVGGATPVFLSGPNVMNVLRQAAPYIALALSTALVSVPNGHIDLSLGSMLAYASVLVAMGAMDGGALGGVGMALVTCMVFGAVSGVIVVCLKAPSFLVTLLTGGLVRGITYLISDGSPIPVELTFFGLDGPSSALLLILLAGGIAAGLCFLTKFLTKKSKAFGILPFAGAGAIAALTGYYMTIRLGSAQPVMGMGYEYMLIFAWAALSTSKLLGRTPLALVVALLPGYYYTVFTNVFILMNVGSYFLQFISPFLALLFLALAFFLQFLRKRWLGEPPSLMASIK